jgi:malonyl-CoA/methylmalonyl-CoA synthetase
VRRSGSVADELQLIGLLRERLARYKVPKRILFVDELPRNAMGKVQKNVLRASHQALYSTR